jgi:hypothetical protein
MKRWNGACNCREESTAKKGPEMCSGRGWQRQGVGDGLATGFGDKFQRFAIERHLGEKM